MCKMTFHVTSARKVLASVTKLNESGTIVHLEKGNNYLESPLGQRAHLQRKNGLYVLDVVYICGETTEKGEVIIDSGAADHVMPKDMLESIEMKPKSPTTSFVTAGGKPLDYYGRKEITSVPVEFWDEAAAAPFQRRD